MVNALREVKLQSSPIILSTRDNGFPSYTSPSQSDFNYVIAMVTIDSVDYLLDATDRNLPFGLIPFRCVNFEGRIVDGSKSDWVSLQSSKVSMTQYHFEGTLSEEGKLNGDLFVSFGGYTAVDKRAEIKASNSEEEYWEDFEAKNNSYKILKSELMNLDSADGQLGKKLGVEIQKFAHGKEKNLVFNPLFVGGTRKNPFNLEERLYPVDLGTLIQESARFEIHLPKGYKLVNQPKNVSMSLPDKAGRYIYRVIDKGESIEIEMLMSLNKNMYMPDEYLTLKEFFSRIIQSQKVDFTLTKE